jgi:SAM-dependent methyltransferase
MFNRLRRGENGREKPHWARAVMDLETRRLIEELSPETCSALEISGTAWRTRVRFQSYRSVAFPEFDICDAGLAEKFDIIIAEQVFEHLHWPGRAARNVLGMLKPGGHFLITTPFLIRVHNVPTDCTRWTETGIRYFLAECGFPLEQIRTGAWGNRPCVKANFTDWPTFRPWLHSLRNEPEFPVVVWALARSAHGDTSTQTASHSRAQESGCPSHAGPKP